jgi:hypothetical protein
VSVASAAARAAHTVARIVDRLLERPREVLGALVAVQIVATVVLALSVEHNGWVWFQGGDQIWMTTTAWLWGQLQLPPTELGYLWALVEMPMTWVTGSTFVQLLPILVVLQVLVLAPVALLCVYGIAARIGGRLLGYWAAFLWVVAPYAVIPLWVERYRERWTEQFLPQALGLTALADFPSMVLALAAALLVVRSLEAPRRWTDAVLAGLLLGAAVALKPSNVLVGGGVVPALALEQARLAAGAGPAFLDLRINRYLDLDVHHWRVQMDQLREFFWSPRIAQWSPIAGLIAVLRVRRGALAALLGGWLAAFVVVKGFSPRADIQANTFWRLLMPAWPAYLLLFASIPLLVPTLARRLGERMRPARSSPVAVRWIAVAAAVTVAVPGIAIAASTAIERPTPEVVQDFPGSNLLTPVDSDIDLRVEREGSARRLRWSRGADWRADVFYRVYRKDGDEDLLCLLSGGTAWYCHLTSTPIATTRDTTFVDPSAPPTATYRVGVGTNWANDPAEGDVFVVSPPVTVR